MTIHAHPLHRRTAVAATVLTLLAAPAAVQAHPAPDGFADLVDSLSPSVVAVTVERAHAAPSFPRRFDMPRGFPFERFFGFKRDFDERGPRAPAAGSGFIVDPDGYIVTNHHVVDGAREIAVTLASGERLDATLVGADGKTDLALLKVEANRPLPALRWGDSDKVQVGDWSLAIGNPFGLGGTVTAGIISGRARDINAGPFDDFLQTDAPINPGNSGGPLFDLDGTVIGVNTAIVSPSGGNVGIGFAIPAALAAPIVEQLRMHGRPVRGWLGVRLQTLTDDIAAGLDLADDSGALIAGVVPGTPAETAGLQTGDVIVSYGDGAVDSPRRLARLVSETPAGETMALGVMRDGAKIDLEVTIAELVETAAVEGPGAVPSEARLGLTVTPADDGKGLAVHAVAPGSPAAHAGLRPGDIIREAGRQAVADPAALDKAVAEAEAAGRAALLFLIERDGNPIFRAAPLATG